MSKPLRATNHCRHYSYRNTGLSGFMRGDRGVPQCAAGIDLSEPKAVQPCMPPDGSLFAGECPKREEYTNEERAAWKAARDESRGRMGKIMPLIPGQSQKRDEYWGKGGSFDCPCCTGKVEWSRSSYNGHVHARCTTPDCFGVIQ